MPSDPVLRWDRTTHKESTLSPEMVRYTHWMVLRAVVFSPLKKYIDMMSGPADVMPWMPWLILNCITA